MLEIERMLDPEPKLPECPLCDKPGILTCGGCGNAFYCSKEHKTKHWHEHSLECTAFKINYSPIHGRYFTASRKLKTKNLILIDDPFAVAPLGCSELTCLSCLAPIYDEKFYKCPDCKWPMCSLECSLKKQHTAECCILMRDEKLYGPPSQQGVTPRYDIIAILRCLLLKEHDPKAWKHISFMVSHANNKNVREDPHHVAAIKFITEVYKMDVNIEDVHHVRGVLVANAMEIRGPLGNKYRALYPIISFINHSCIPNIHLSCQSNGKMEVRAAVDIEKGEELCITYTGTDILRWERQECLSDIHFFTCNCKRCSDPTELGSYFSSPKCPQCQNEYLIPQIKSGNSNLWSCKKCNTNCNTTELKQEIDDWLFRMDMNELFGTSTPHKIQVAIGQILKSFHETHFIFLKAAQIALKKLSSNNSWSVLRLRKELWEKILVIYNILEPGFTRRRAMTLVELGRTCKALAKILAEDADTSKYLIENYLRDSKSFYREAYEILQLEPNGTPEKQIANSLQCFL